MQLSPSVAKVDIPTRQPRGARRRESLLRAALQVIGERGIAATTHRAVAERAGVPVAATTYYFVSRDDLLEQALRLFVDEEVARLGALADALAAAGTVPAARAAALFADELTAGSEAQEREKIAQFELYLEATRRPALQAAAADCLRAYDAVAEAAMRAAGAPRPAAAARAAVALIDGMGVDAMAGGATRRAEDVRLALLALFEGFAALSPEDDGDR